MSPQPGDNAGLVYLLDAAGRTIQTLEQHREALEAAVAELRAELARVRLDNSDTRGVTQGLPDGAEDGQHETDPPRSHDQHLAGNGE